MSLFVSVQTVDGQIVQLSPEQASLWATVTSIDPLRIILDKPDTAALPFTPDTLIAAAQLAVDDRVWCGWSNGHLTIQGVAGGPKPVDYTPTFAGITLGNGTVDARYVDLGDFVIIRFKITLGTTSAITGTIGIASPSGMSVSTAAGGSAYFQDASAGTGARYPCFVYRANNIQIRLDVQLVSGAYVTNSAVTATIPFTWAATDTIQGVLIFAKD
jgi:hypothetical protein